MILRGGGVEVGVGRGGGFEVANNAGISIRKPKKVTRYRPKKRPTTIKKNEKIARFRFKTGLDGARPPL